jgi:hypothetical protein
MELHIGTEISKVLEQKGIKPEFLAKQINTSRRNVYDILKRKEIGTGQLVAISKALHFDFFALYQDEEIPDVVSEPSLNYIKRARVVVSVELDGLESTLKEWVSKLTAINQVI